MSLSDPACRQCRTAMEKGFTLDRGHANSPNLVRWAQGEPTVRKWLGMSIGFSLRGRKLVDVETWRCPRCGLLESYAR